MCQVLYWVVGNVVNCVPLKIDSKSESCELCVKVYWGVSLGDAHEGK